MLGGWGISPLFVGFTYAFFQLFVAQSSYDFNKEMDLDLRIAFYEE